MPGTVTTTMTNILTVMGKANLWDDKRPEIINSDFDTVKKKITLTFLLRDSQGAEYSVDKLKMYGVKNYDLAQQTFEVISKDILTIDLTKQNEVRLGDKRVALQVIECDKYEYNQKRVRKE